jgi:glucose-6-phosphate isomerase
MLHIKYPFGELEIDENYTLRLNGILLKAQYRRLGDMHSVLFDPSIIEKMDENTILYSMFREVMIDEHKPLFREHKIRFDVTIMAPTHLGEELNKTLGHRHPEAIKGLSYPEVSSILHGHACFLFQKMEEGIIKEFKAIFAETGDTVITPPNYGHVTVNCGDEMLVTSNLVSTNFKSDYKDYIEMAGAAYYLLKGRKFVQNKRYGRVPKPAFSNERFLVTENLYADFLKNPNKFDFLNDPTKLPLPGSCASLK